ncbi:MAG: hypothetical protein JSV89_10880 [Spirochaetaceae bacterium]|nr:MAG: hypothetical protein JSV89_10880 [Spirochaetaceae bacterium]
MLLTVPGNLLLLGEYAVTEEGGLGLALAVERRVAVEIEPASTLLVEGYWGGGGLRWSRESPGQSPLISAIVDTWQEQLALQGYGSSTGTPPVTGIAKKSPQLAPQATSAVKAARIVMDSSVLFSGGRKSGFGSSAAITVALSCALLRLSGLSGVELVQWAGRIALKAHRRAQGGRGSGYDVFASLYGGFGCLVGGLHPTWQAVELPWLPPLYIFPGRTSVSTPNSLTRYERWKHSDPSRWRRFLKESNRSVRNFLQADSWSQARLSFMNAKELGLELGERIGVSADIQAPPSLSPELYKALGAGDELGIYLAEIPPQEPDAEAVEVAREGVQWNI